MSDRKIVIVGDDFGLSAENNAGIIAAHEHGVMPATCLMVGGEAAAEAVAYARQHPSLAVGLHVSFSDTRPALPPEQIPLLVQPDGHFPPDDAAHRAALRSAKGRTQIAAEIAGQFRAFFATGLPCDHVNTHRHAHRNPAMALLLFREAAKWGVKATRIPWEPSGVLRYARAILLRRLATHYNLAAPDRCVGRKWSGLVLSNLLVDLPPGIHELYFHPVAATNHMFAADLPALLDPQVKEALNGVTLRGVGDAVFDNQRVRA